MVTVISPEEGEELNQLYAEWPPAVQRATSALRTEPPAHRLEGAALERFLEEDAKFGAIVARIKEILGVTGQQF